MSTRVVYPHILEIKLRDRECKKKKKSGFVLNKQTNKKQDFRTMKLAALEDSEHQINTNFPEGVSLTGICFSILRYI